MLELLLAELPLNNSKNDCYNIEGPFILNNVTAYILGMNAFKNNMLEFTILTSDNNIIEYNLINDSKTNTYYGRWNIIKDNGRFFGGYAKVKVNASSMSIVNMDKKIEIFGHNKFYPKYSNIVSKLLLTKNSTLTKYNFDYSNEMYKYSKNYFVTENVIVDKLLVKRK